MRIAHLSDLHLRCHLPGEPALASRAGREMPGVLERALARVADWGPDLLVVSGDLIDYPLDALDDPEMRASGVADLRLIADLLAAAPCPRVVIPGNHDPDDLARAVFGDLSVDRVMGDYRVLAFWDCEGPGHVPARLGADRALFEAALADPDPRPQIHIQHYLLWPPIAADYPYNYADASEMSAAAEASGRVRLALSGHYHAGVSPTRRGGVWYATAPALAEAPHRYWLYDLTLDGLAWAERTVEE